MSAPKNDEEDRAIALADMGAGLRRSVDALLAGLTPTERELVARRFRDLRCMCVVGRDSLGKQHDVRCPAAKAGAK